MENGGIKEQGTRDEAVVVRGRHSKLSKRCATQAAQIASGSARPPEKSCVKNWTSFGVFKSRSNRANADFAAGVDDSSICSLDQRVRRFGYIIVLLFLLIWRLTFSHHSKVQP